MSDHSITYFQVLKKEWQVSSARRFVRVVQPKHFALIWLIERYEERCRMSRICVKTYISWIITTWHGLVFCTWTCLSRLTRHVEWMHSVHRWLIERCWCLAMPKIYRRNKGKEIYPWTFHLDEWLTCEVPFAWAKNVLLGYISRKPWAKIINRRHLFTF